MMADLNKLHLTKSLTLVRSRGFEPKQQRKRLANCVNSIPTIAK
jgi:hypothetical protein